MITVEEKNKCCGCSACAQACPVSCIQMIVDKEGFLYPSVDKDKCIGCNKCDKVCPIINNSKQTEDCITAYAAYSKSNELLEMSSSGAIFSEVALKILQDGGVVFGAAFDENLMVKHIYIESEEDLYKLQGSKYLQSVIGNTYKETEDFLKQGRKVLYVGTACQIAGLKQYLSKDYDSLFTIDVLCHGTPSPFVWKKYLDSIKRGQGFGKIVKARFRLKKPNWQKYSLEFTSEDGNVIDQLYYENSYMKLFLGNLCLRPSCYSCSFKYLDRYSDITLGDCWGVENSLPEMFNDRGVSVVIIHSEKGVNVFNDIKNSLVYKEENVDKLLPKSADSRHSVKCPKNRKRFFKKFARVDDINSLVKYTQPSALKKLYRRLMKKKK